MFFVGAFKNSQGQSIVLKRKGPQQIEEVYAMFDSDKSGHMSKKEIQIGFRDQAILDSLLTHETNSL